MVALEFLVPKSPRSSQTVRNLGGITFLNITPKHEVSMVDVIEFLESYEKLSFKNKELAVYTIVDFKKYTQTCSNTKLWRYIKRLVINNPTKKLLLWKSIEILRSYAKFKLNLK